MPNHRSGTAVLLGTLIALGCLSTSAQAKPGNSGNGNGNGNGNRPPEAVVIPSDDAEDANLPAVTFSSQQQQQLVEAIYGDGDYAHLIPQDVRVEILSNRYSLPPGIQQRIERGGTLPPGIAKKVYLPIELYSIFGLPTGTQLLVVGPNIVTVDSTTDRILNLLENILLD